MFLPSIPSHPPSLPSLLPSSLPPWKKKKKRLEGSGGEVLSRPGGGTTCQGSARNATLSPLVLSVVCYQEGDGDNAQAQLSPSSLVLPSTVAVWELSRNALCPE